MLFYQKVTLFPNKKVKKERLKASKFKYYKYSFDVKDLIAVATVTPSTFPISLDNLSVL